jgi:SAM-dependent methyltransferase
MPLDHQRKVNRANWDSRVDTHFSSEEYGVARFQSDPAHLSGVVQFDRTNLGDIAGKSLVHLQCHIGTDTVSLARLGAKVTGVDFSEKSIEAARHLSDLAATPARFVVSEVYDTPDTLAEKFDIVYTGVGAICWLPDIAGWARVVSELLKPGGMFYLREGHPVMWSLDFENKDDGRLSFKYPYFEGEPNEFDFDYTYAGQGLVSHPKTFDWNHGVGEILSALIGAGLRLDAIDEYDFCEWQGLDNMVETDEGVWRLPEESVRIPLMWSVRATKMDDPH